MVVMVDELLGIREIAYFFVSIRNFLAYKVAYLKWLLIPTLNLIAFIFVWTTLLSGGRRVGSYDIHAMILYYLLAYIIGFIVSGGVEEKVSGQVVGGDISMILIRPVSYAKHLFFSSLGDRFPLMLVYCVVLVATFIHYNLDILNLVWGAVFLTIGLFTSFLWGTIVGYSSFFVENNWGVKHAMYFVSTVASGAWLPLDILPTQIQGVLNLLFFRFIKFVPIKVMQGSYTSAQMISLIGVGLVWIVALYLTSIFIYSVGIKRLAAHGV